MNAPIPYLFAGNHTRLSSAGVGASFMGVPAVYALFDDLGKRYLKSNKDYDTLPWCNEGCAFLIQREVGIKNLLECAIFDETSRPTVRANFQSRFMSKADSGQAIAAQIQAVLWQRQAR